MKKRIINKMEKCFINMKKAKKLKIFKKWFNQNQKLCKKL